MTNKTKGKRGPVPPAALLQKMHAAGYYTVKEIADAFDLAPTTVYTWADPIDPKLEDVDGKPATRKVASNVWVLKAAVEKRMEIPAEMKAGSDV